MQKLAARMFWSLLQARFLTFPVLTQQNKARIVPSHNCWPRSKPPSFPTRQATNDGFRGDHEASPAPPHAIQLLVGSRLAVPSGSPFRTATAIKLRPHSPRGQRPMTEGHGWRGRGEGVLLSWWTPESDRQHSPRLSLPGLAPSALLFRGPSSPM